ncbi:MAG: thiamine diphosphokinase [Elusimicrobium sp.]|jgi:thiamine pyrophosphokinase|nr:thiamine diphosphokinase [Elusimicrobium sp.]
MEKALIICNGSTEPAKFLRAQAKNNFVLCADGGANIAAAAGVTPDAVIGDMDSVTAKTRTKFKKIPWLKIRNQNNTDFEKALDFVKKSDIKKAVIVCAAGGRLDFTLSNLLATARYLPYFDIVFKSRAWEIYPINKTKKFSCRAGTRVSLLPLAACAGVSLSGLEYALKNKNLTPADTLTLSNRAVNNNFEVRIKKGLMLVYIEV